MLEDETGVGEVVGALFVARDSLLHVALAQEQERLLSRFLRLPARLRDLLRRAFDAQHRRPRGARHVPRELSEARAEIDDLLAAAQAELAEGGAVEEIVQAREARLLFGIGAVKVAAAALYAHALDPRMPRVTRRRPAWRLPLLVALPARGAPVRRPPWGS